jgi:AcrR family transcriptional regulator
MLQEALQQLLETKSFEKIAVAEIAAQAAVNRATFYDHYPDKLTLLEDLVSRQFEDLLAKRNVVFDGQCSGAITGIALAMCDYLTGMPRVDCPEHRRLEKHFESALMSVVRRMILEGLSQHPPSLAAPPELIAATITGAIYGGVSEWARTQNRRPVEEAVRTIAALANAMLVTGPSAPDIASGHN